MFVINIEVVVCTPHRSNFNRRLDHANIEFSGLHCTRYLCEELVGSARELRFLECLTPVIMFSWIYLHVDDVNKSDGLFMFCVYFQFHNRMVPNS